MKEIGINKIEIGLLFTHNFVNIFFFLLYFISRNAKIKS